MARTIAELPEGARIASYISLEMISKTFPMNTIEPFWIKQGKPVKDNENCRRKRNHRRVKRKMSNYTIRPNTKPVQYLKNIENHNEFPRPKGRGINSITFSLPIS